MGAESAFQGLKAAKTLPNRTLITGNPIQMVTKTSVVARFLSGASVPSSPE